MPRAALCLLRLALWAGALPAPPPLIAQEPPAADSEGATPSSRDSARLLREARGAQAQFERVRRNHLPWAWGGGSGSCDERIGRFCLTYDTGGPDWTPPPEAQEVTAARARLIEQLDEVARLLPGESWVAGQRVRYLVESRRLDEARRAAGECRAEGWWCAALAGYVHHRAGEPQRADSAFSDAIRRMPDEERRRWTDLSYLLDGGAYRDFRRLDPPERERFAERFWRLADPLFMRPGNELRSEHFARNVMDQFQDRARSAEGISWGDDLRQILLRYGWPVGWERIRERPGSLDPPSLLSHYASTDRELVPPLEVLRGGIGAEWDVENPRARTGYSVPLPDSAARWFRRLDHQLAVFRRGDSALVLAAYQLPPDSLPPATPVDAALALVSTGDGPWQVTRFAAGGTRDVLVTVAPADSLLVSLEVLAERAYRAGRARYGLVIPRRAPGLIAASDLLLLREPEPLPDSLAAAVAAARGSVRVRPGERLGVYWEIYGLESAPALPVSMSLRLLDQRAGWLRRLARRAGLVAQTAPIRLRWQEQPTPEPHVSRSMTIQIPAVEPGAYTLELTVELPGREPLSVRRQVEVSAEPG